MMKRRSFIAAGLSGLTLSAMTPGIALARANTKKRFVFIIQRGAADGLATVAPIGDPNYLSARGPIAREALTGAKLDSIFALHPKMTESAKLFKSGQASFVHAVASTYRQRSHFDAQNILESGGGEAYARKDGWMNRLLSLLPRDQAKALAIGQSVPLALRGEMPATSYESSRANPPADDMAQRVAMLYAEDAELSGLWDDAVKTDAMAGMSKGNRNDGAVRGKMVAGLMAGPQGANIVMMESNGWDTHSRQMNRLGNQLKNMDQFMAALKAGLGSDWNDTLVLVATEFGRTVAFNGTQGTDHGTASAAMLFGGGLEYGGKVISDWPGLKKSNLYEGRDLMPTMRFEDMVSNALAHHYGLDQKQVRGRLFPDIT